MSLVFSSVSFRYPGAPCPLFRGLTLTFPPGWTGVVGANGSGKTPLLRHLLPLLRIPPDRVLWLPQELESTEAAEGLRPFPAQEPRPEGSLLGPGPFEDPGKVVP